MMNYNEMAAVYAPNRQINLALLESLLTKAVPKENSTVLEVGCGTGNYIGAIAQACNGICHGVDPSSEMLVAARERQPSVIFEQGAAESLPFEANQFDLVYSVDVIHHVTDIHAYFYEVFRILKPGGLFCTATDSVDVIRRRRPLSSHFPETVAVELERYPAIDRLTMMMAAVGFHDIIADDVDSPYALTDIEPYQQRAFSCLHLISEEAHRRGLERLTADLKQGPIAACTLYTLIWATR